MEQFPSSRRRFMLASVGAMLAAHAPLLRPLRAEPTDMKQPVPGTPPPLPLHSLRLLAPDLEKARQFYEKTLGLAVEEEGEFSIVVRAGASRIIFDEWKVWHWPRDKGPPPAPFYHVAFNIPENQLDAALEWARARFPILRNNNGTEVYHFETWNAHAFYFYDPAGNLLEFIARHTLPNASAKPFGPESIGEVSEIGLVFPDVPAAVDQAIAALGVQPYLGRRSDTFTALGDERGLFIMVKTGREWLGSNRPCAVFRTRIETRGDGRTHSPFGDLPYVITTRA